MSTLGEAAQQALEVLEAFMSDELRPYEAAKTAANLRAALAEPVQEPVAIVGTQEDVWRGYGGQWAPPGSPIKTVHMLRDLPHGTLLYTVPPQRPAEPQEPVALDWLHKWANQDDGEPETQWHEGYEAARRVVQIHLTAPPQRKPLTEDDLRKLADKHLFYQPESYEVSGVFALARAVERAQGIT